MFTHTRMNTYVIVHLSNLSVNAYYDADAPNYSMFGGENGNPQASAHLSVPEGLTWDAVVAVRADDGTITLQADPSKVQAKIQQAWTALRTERNARLAACDWTQMPDSPLSQAARASWSDYRQSLRDLPENATDPTQVTWPVSPSQ